MSGGSETPQPLDRRRREHSTLTAWEREERARNAARARWDANPYDRTDATAPAREAMFRKFELQVDPEWRLDPQVRYRRALAAESRYMTDLARKSAAARRDPAND